MFATISTVEWFHLNKTLFDLQHAGPRRRDISIRGIDKGRIANEIVRRCRAVAPFRQLYFPRRLTALVSRPGTTHTVVGGISG